MDLVKKYLTAYSFFFSLSLLNVLGNNVYFIDEK